jgi:hypothetical protein
MAPNLIFFLAASIMGRAPPAAVVASVLAGVLSSLLLVAFSAPRAVLVAVVDLAVVSLPVAVLVLVAVSLPVVVLVLVAVWLAVSFFSGDWLQLVIASEDAIITLARRQLLGKVLKIFTAKAPQIVFNWLFLDH